jgi:hypothetical protein
VSNKRYNVLKSYIESGGVNSFTEIFDIIPKSTIVRDSGIKYVRLTNKITHPDKFTVKDILAISKLIGIDSPKLYDLIAIAADKPLAKAADKTSKKKGA